jgi:hypothetical protein
MWQKESETLWPKMKPSSRRSNPLLLLDLPSDDHVDCSRHVRYARRK